MIYVAVYVLSRLKSICNFFYFKYIVWLKFWLDYKIFIIFLTFDNFFGLKYTFLNIFYIDYKNLQSFKFWVYIMVYILDKLKNTHNISSFNYILHLMF